MTGSIARALKHTHYHFYYAKQRRKIFQEGKNTKEEKDQDGRGGNRPSASVRVPSSVRPRRIASKYEKWDGRGRGWKWRPRAADNWEVETADEGKVLFFINIWESSLRLTTKTGWLWVQITMHIEDKKKSSPCKPRLEK